MPEASKKYLWEILVPTIMKNKPIHTRYHNVWDRFVSSVSGGLTIYQPSVGYWIDEDGETIRERMIPVRIMCSEDDINKIVVFSANYYEQDCIMYYKVSDEVKIFYRSSFSTRVP